MKMVVKAALLLVAGILVIGAGFIVTRDPAPTQVNTLEVVAGEDELPPTEPPDHVVAVGDSIMLGAKVELEQLIDDITIDAEVGRQFSAGIEALRKLLAAEGEPDLVIVHLGTNGAVTGEQFDKMMALTQGVPRVLFVNVKVPRPWEQLTNDTLAAGVARYPNASLIDWHSHSVSRAEFFTSGGYHLRPTGNTAYAELISAGV